MRNLQKGFSTLEMLIALALVALVVSAVLLVSGTGQNLVMDSQTNTEALHKAQQLLESATQTARQNFESVVPTSGTYGIYTTLTDVPADSVSACSKKVVSKVSWPGTSGRNLYVGATTTVSNVPLMLSMGGNCDTAPPGPGWNPPSTWASSNFNPGKPKALDSLDRIVYMGGDKSPYLYIADTSSSFFGQSSGLFVNFSNGFDDGATINDIRVARASDGQVYAFVARNANTNQFEVIRVTDIHNPVSIVKKSLAGISGGSQPQGFRVYYFNKRAYVVTQETSGPELHIFDVSTPGTAASVVELGSGTELNRTVEELVVTKKNVAGTDHLIMYTATDKNAAELSVFDVTNPASVTEVTASNQDLPGNQDGASVYLVGDYLYFGRTAVSGNSEIYIYYANNPLTGLTLKQQKDIGTGALSMAVSGNFIFVATPLNNSEFQVWSANPNSAIVRVNTTNFNFPNTITRGVKYENNWVYVASQANDALRIIYSP